MVPELDQALSVADPLVNKSQKNILIFLSFFFFASLRDDQLVTLVVNILTNSDFRVNKRHNIFRTNSFDG